MFNYDSALQDERNIIFTNIHNGEKSVEFEPETDFYDEELIDGETVYYVDENILKEDNVEKYAMEKIKTLTDEEMLKLALLSSDFSVMNAIDNVRESLLECLENNPDEILEIIEAEEETYEE